jgi:MFS family permease
MQLGASEHNRGLIMGIWLTVLAGAQPTGNLVAGWCADHYGIEAVLLVEGVGILAASAVAAMVYLIYARRGE